MRPRDCFPLNAALFMANFYSTFQPYSQVSSAPLWHRFLRSLLFWCLFLNFSVANSLGASWQQVYFSWQRRCFKVVRLEFSWWIQTFAFALAVNARLEKLYTSAHFRCYLFIFPVSSYAAVQGPVHVYNTIMRGKGAICPISPQCDNN